MEFYGASLDLWGTVCNHDVTRGTATVFCNSLGLPSTGAEVLPNFGGGDSDQIWFDELQCEGTETEISRCRLLIYAVDSEHECTKANNIGAYCK